METAAYAKTLLKIDSLTRKGPDDFQANFELLFLQTDSEEWLAFLTKSIPFWVSCDQIGLKANVKGLQRLPGGEEGSNAFSICLETDPAQPDTSKPSSGAIKSFLMSSAPKKLQVCITKPLELDDKTLALIKQKKKVLDPGASFNMTVELDISSWNSFNSTFLPCDGLLTDNLTPEDLKALNLEGKTVTLCSELRTSRPLVTLKDPRTSLTGLMNTGGLKPKHDIKEVLKDLVGTLKFLIPKLITDYVSSFDKSLHSSEDFKKMNVFTEQQKIQFLTQRKLTYLTSFFSTKKFSVLQKHLQSLAHRFVYDKLIKSNCFRFDRAEVERNLNSLYVEVQMITSRIIQAYFQKYAEEIPFELKYFDAHKAKEHQNFVQFFADEPEDFFKKIKDYEKIGRWHMSAALLKQATWRDGSDVSFWHNLMIFYCRRQNFLLAESCFDRLVALDWQDKSRSLLQICFLLNRGRVAAARKLIEANLATDRCSMVDNLMLSAVLEQHFDKPKLAKKHFRVAKQKFLKTMVYAKSSTTQGMSSNDKSDKSVPANDDEVDADVWKDLIGQLMKFNFVDLVQSLLPKAKARPIFCSLTLANVAITQGNYLQSNAHFDTAIQALEGLPEGANQINEAILSKACNSFFLKHFYEAETLFLAYFKQTTVKKNYFDVLLMLGQCYLHRQSFAEAEEVFLKLTTLRPKSAVAWTGLGVAAMHLDNLDRAEEALYFASKLETLDYEVVAQTLILFVKKYAAGQAQMEGITKVWSILKDYEVDNLDLIVPLKAAVLSLEDKTMKMELDQQVGVWKSTILKREQGIEGPC